MVNSNSPSLPSLSEMDKADADSFLRNVELLLPVLGCNILEKAPDETPGAKSAPNGVVFVASSLAVNAKAVLTDEGLRVLQGSEAVLKPSTSVPKSAISLRAKLEQDGVLRKEGGKWVFQQDYTFTSANMACSVVVGNMHGPRTAWQTSDGMTLAEYMATQIDDKASASA